jgi:hypothetical protein
VSERGRPKRRPLFTRSLQGFRCFSMNDGADFRFCVISGLARLDEGALRRFHPERGNDRPQATGIPV